MMYTGHTGLGTVHSVLGAVHAELGTIVGKVSYCAGYYSRENIILSWAL